MRLDNRIALVSGVGSANGRVIALGFAQEGADLALVDEDSVKAEAVAQQVRDMGRRALPLPCNVTRKSEVEEMVRRTVAQFGRINILMNATGVAHNQEFLNFKEEDFDHALAVGYKAFFLTAQAVAKQMVHQGTGGKIINLSSIVGRLGSGEAVAWCTTRAGVDAMTRAMGQGFGYYGINVNALAHGGVEGANYGKAEAAERRRRIPFGRLGTPEDLVGPAIFLASADSNFVTGETLYVDGGYTTAAVTEEPFRPEWARAIHTADGPRTDRYVPHPAYGPWPAA